MSAGLAEQQQALLLALWQPRQPDAIATAAAHVESVTAAGQRHWQRGLHAYRSNGQELAQRTLAAAYPVVASLIGPDDFSRMARQLWQQYPPVQGDLGQWGQPLARLLASLPELTQAEPYLADVATVEWALHRAATAADAQADFASFSLLAEGDPAQLNLVLSPGLFILDSGYPVASIINAHLLGEPTLAEAGRRLEAQAAESVVVWREGLKPRLRQADAGEATFLAAVQEGQSLADSLSSAPAFDFTGWLASAVQSGLLVGARGPTQ